MAEPLVSILIPAFNAENVISFSIKSALAQTWEKKEVIVVDDGSTDHTCKVAEECARYGRLSVVREPHRGASAARNAALRLSKGDYIQWLDADDFLAPDKISQQLQARSIDLSPKTLLSGAWGYFLYRTRKASFNPTALWSDLSPVEWLMEKFQKNLFMPNSTWLVSRHLSDTTGPWNEEISLDDDGEYFARMLQASDGVKFVSEAKALYRQSGAVSLSDTTRASAKLDSQFLSMKLQVGYLLAMEDSNRTRRSCVAYLQQCAQLFAVSQPDLVERVVEILANFDTKVTPSPGALPQTWSQTLLGWPGGRRFRRQLNETKWRVLRSVDRLLFNLESKDN